MSNTLPNNMLRLSELPEYIANAEQKNVTFISIGGNHNCREARYETNHQFPSFIQDMYKQMPRTTFRIVAIDPAKYPLWFHPDETFEKDPRHENIYKSKRIEIIDIKEYVYLYDTEYFIKLDNAHMTVVDTYRGDQNGTTINMCLMFLHVFTGEDMSSLKRQIGIHHSKNGRRGRDKEQKIKKYILYDLCCSGNYGCSPDMSDYVYRPVVKYSNSEYIIVDYCSCSNTDLRNIKTHNIALEERYRVYAIVRNRITQFINNQLSIFRRILLCDLKVYDDLKHNPDKIIDSTMDLYTELLQIDVENIDELQYNIDRLVKKTTVEFISNVQNILQLSDNCDMYYDEITLAMSIDDVYKKDNMIREVLKRILNEYA